MKDEVYYEPAAARSPAFLFRRVSWGAIFAGLVVTMVIQLLFTVLGVAIGATAFNPTQQQNPTEGLAIGSAIWILVTGLISLFCGAFVAGRLSGGPRRADGMLHGVVTWGVTTLAMMFLLATATGAAIGGVGALLGGAMQTGSSQQGQTGISSLQNMIPGMSATGRQPGQEDQGSLSSMAAKDPELGAALARMTAKGGPAGSPADRDQVINLLTTKHGIDQQQASSMINQWDQQARQKGEQAAGAVSKGAWWGFLALLLGILIAAWGGWAGTASIPSRLEPTAAPAT